MKPYFVLKTGVKKIFLNYSFSWAKTGAKKKQTSFPRNLPRCESNYFYKPNINDYLIR